MCAWWKPVVSIRRSLCCSVYSQPPTTFRGVELEEGNVVGAAFEDAGRILGSGCAKVKEEHKGGNSGE